MEEDSRNDAGYDYDTIKKCFDKTEFSGRPGNFSGTFFQKGKTGISTTEGKYWTSQREFLMSHLAHITGKLTQELSNRNSFITRNLLGPGVKSLEDVVMDEVEDLKIVFTRFKVVFEEAKVLGEPSRRQRSSGWLVRSRRRSGELFRSFPGASQKLLRSSSGPSQAFLRRSFL